uniref:Uncharacterized protein n=1 Tax=Noctiluca scintillans TaxID=2966 RepID=A0A7S0ZQC4_NOCSC|mmetsp:Transcript_14581/g.40080  ORF Transcript_14581/g.40080 Transcript_14581/m.40080 type:complete len:1001 (+) Transcript_14581:46-3048(+)
MFCLGPFCGRFPDEHQDSDDDDETDQTKAARWDWRKDPKMFRKKTPSRKRRQDDSSSKDKQSGNSAAYRWTASTSTILVPIRGGEGTKTVSQSFKRIATSDVHLPPSMLNSISQLGNVHTIELTRCALTDLPPSLDNLEMLHVVSLKYNHLTTFPRDISKCSKIEKIILDHNFITMVPQAVFGPDTFSNLEVLTLSNNQISLLPHDFARTGSHNNIAFVDLSNNRIPRLPESICQCKNLSVLDVSQNKLDFLPELRLRNLKKLFVSFNQLRRLPESIGDCSLLEKIRMVSNHVKELPVSILKLWDKKEGHLEEFLVDKNPLVRPSITAFEMGGIDQAFALFERSLQDGALAIQGSEGLARKMIQDTEATMLAVKDQTNGATEALSKGEGYEARSGDFVDQCLEKFLAEPVHAPYRNIIKWEEPGVYQFGNQKVKMRVDSRTHLLEAMDKGTWVSIEEFILNLEKSHHYYFSKYRGDTKKIQAVRCMEATLLLKKKQMYIDKVKSSRRAHKKGQESVKDDGWNDMVRITDLDLYFNLLVYNSKAMFSTCQTLFDNFEKGGDDRPPDKMTRHEFEALCQAVLETVSEEIVDQMWGLMSVSRDANLELCTFVAAWHIHDISAPDPWIKRMAQVLHLEYYSMTMKEMRERLRAKGASDPSPLLEKVDVDSDDDIAKDHDTDSDTSSTKANRALQLAGTIALPVAEGERQVVAPWVVTSFENHHDAALDLLNETSLQRHDRVPVDNSDRDESDMDFSSGQLSVSSSSSDAFDMVDFVKKGQPTEVVTPQSLTELSGEERMKRLMTMNAKEFNASKVTGKIVTATAEAKGKNGKNKKKKSKTKRSTRHDPRYNTMVIGVRQAIRDVFRNLPFNDFVKLINFLLRGLQTIKHPHGSPVTYWHHDDPTFKYTMGLSATNKYTRALLVEMGFVEIRKYWVWPAQHLSMGGKSTALTWGEREVDQSCHGKNALRLDDMIKLFQTCQRNLRQASALERFTGHIQDDYQNDG